MASKTTPMMQQYLEIKEQYPDAFLFYRVGDFYELFFDDAVEAARLLELTLTSRNKNVEDSVPMCGVPYHAVWGYIDTLVEGGHKVALCDQVEDPKQAKGMVRREVTQVITPGTYQKEGKENNFIVSIVAKNKGYSLAYSDLMTGELKVTQLSDEEEVLNECSQLNTKEIVYHQTLPKSLISALEMRLSLTFSYQATLEHHQSDRLKAIDNAVMQEALNILLSYLESTQRKQLPHLKDAEIYEPRHFLKMDYYSKFNLELTQAIRTKKRQGTLLWVMDRTQTAMGSRLLKQWLNHPLVSQEKIEHRLDCVASLLDSTNHLGRLAIIDRLKSVYDLERLVGKVAMLNINARELYQLKTTLEQLPPIVEELKVMDEALWHPLVKKLHDLSYLVKMIDAAIDPDAPITITEGGIIKPGYDTTLDQYIEVMDNAKKWLLQLEAKEKEETGIKNLKIKYNKVFGYFIEMSKAAAQTVEEGRYERKQTLTNSERFVTEELKTLEKMILEAEEKRYDREYELFVEVRQAVAKETKALQEMATAIAEVDVLQSMATLSLEKNYVRPSFNTHQSLIIKEGRHPVVEEVLSRQEYVPNDIVMEEKDEILLITGPNMSGKSTYMRQLALTIIMAQMGCFVPAKEANLPVFDQIFTRIGASDDLVAGQSTFMVEMMEANHALRHATSQSLILFDELGRGTATYDGMALAQAIIEYLHDHVHAKTLFSTHYHELTLLDQSLKGLRNIHVGAEEQGDNLVFLHKMFEGPSDQSFGIQVARRADLPEPLLKRASYILEQLEETGHQNEMQLSHLNAIDTVDKVENKLQESLNKEPIVDKTTVHEEQLSLFEETPSVIVEKLKAVNVMNMTPLEAMQLLSELQQEIYKA